MTAIADHWANSAIGDVRASEIETLETQQVRIREALQQARPRMDAIRLLPP